MERKEIYESPVIEEIDIEESFSFGMPPPGSILVNY